MAGVVCLLLALWGLGRLLVETDTMAPADAIYVLDGSFLERAMEAADLFRAGFAPRIIISRGGREPSEDLYAAEGVHLPSHAELVRDVLVTRLGLPASAIEAMPTAVGSTADEAHAIAPIARREHWTRLIVITDRSSTRRAGFIFRRELGAGVTVIPWCSRHDTYDPSRWWAARPAVRLTFYEVPKVLVYWLGLGG